MAKITDLKTKLPYLIEVKSAKEIPFLQPLTTYTTKNPKIFKKLLENRGAENGFDKKRVAIFDELIKMGLFVFEDVHVKINLNCNIIDGYSKEQLCESKGWYINFMVIPDAMFNNIDDKTLLNNICTYNAINSSWNDSNNFRSAFAAKERCAKHIFELIKYVKDRNVLKPNALSPTRIVGIVNNFEKGNTRKESRNTYCREDYADIMETSEFKQKFEGIVMFMEVIHNTNSAIREYAVVKELSILMRKVAKEYDWDKLTYALLQYIKKNKRKYEKFADLKADFIELSKSIIEIAFNK